VLAVAICIFGAIAASGPGPALSFAGDVPADLRALTNQTWERFVAAFPEQRDCMSPVTVAAAWSFDDRAAYEPDTRRVTVRVPATKAVLTAALVHEFAHHLEFTCPGHRHLRPRFLAAQGFARNASWRGGAIWEQIPSEQFAEAVVVAVLGNRTDAVNVVQRWAGTD
jgi:hypothetical protein